MTRNDRRAIMCAEWFITELQTGNRDSALEWLKSASEFARPEMVITDAIRALADAGVMPASEYVRRVEASCASAGINITRETADEVLGFR